MSAEPAAGPWIARRIQGPAFKEFYTIKKQITLLLAMLVLLMFFTACPQQNDPRGGEPFRPGTDKPEGSYDPGLLSTLAGTKWLWGASLLEFNDDTAIFRQNQDIPYAYTEDMTARTGVIITLGNFVISENFKTLEIIDYRNNTPNDKNTTYNAVFVIQDPQAEITIPDTVVGAEWNLHESGERFLACQWIIFFNETEALNQSSGGVFVDEYTYDSTTKRGWIYFINDFEILENGNKLYIPSYKQYGHDMSCVRVK